MRFLVYPDPDQTLREKKLDFDMKNILYEGNSTPNVIKHTCVGTKVISKSWKFGYLLVLVSPLRPESGSAFPKRIRIQKSQINADPYGSGYETLVPQND
jgi:hypothetical protein